MRKPLLLLLCVWLSVAAWAQTSHWNTRDFRLVTNYEVKCDSGCTLLYLLTLVPRTHPGFQDIQKTTFSIKPFRVFTRRNPTFSWLFAGPAASLYGSTMELPQEKHTPGPIRTWKGGDG